MPPSFRPSPASAPSPPACFGCGLRFMNNLRLLVYLVKYESGWVSLEPLLLSWCPSLSLSSGFLWVDLIMSAFFQGERPYTYDHLQEQLLCRYVQRFRGGLVFKAHVLLYHSTLGLRVIKKKRRREHHLIRGGGHIRCPQTTCRGRWGGRRPARLESPPAADPPTARRKSEGQVRRRVLD